MPCANPSRLGGRFPSVSYCTENEGTPSLAPPSLHASPDQPAYRNLSAPPRDPAIHTCQIDSGAAGTDLTLAGFLASISYFHPAIPSAPASCFCNYGASAGWQLDGCI
jgi:hypothetical protein